MPRYASATTVNADRSRTEIERTLARYGASKFMYGWQENAAVVGFEANNRRIRFVLPLPELGEFMTTPTGRRRTSLQGRQSQEQATRQRWRALALAIKAKLETVESNISTFEDEFMAHIVLPDGRTVSEWLTPQIERAYTSSSMPPLLPMRVPLPAE